MKIIQGFVTISKFVNNTPGQTALIGELSTWSRTYSKEKGEYTDGGVPGYVLTTFKVVDPDSGMMTNLTDSEAKEALEIVKEVELYGERNTRPYDPVDFRNSIRANFYGRIAGLEIGQFVDNGELAVPEFMSWTSTANGGNVVKIWLTDAAFSDQYTDYSITVIPPVVNVDTLVGEFSVAKREVESRTIAQMGDIIQAEKLEHPETYVRIYTFELHNKHDTRQKIETHWPVLIYGKSGDTIDAAKDAITEYIRMNSTAPDQVWELVLPELFKRTEFVFIPRWDKLAVPNLTEIAGLYSSMLNAVECVEFARDNIPFYNTTFTEQNTSVMAYPYKQVLMLVVNGEKNISTKKTIQSLYPDYIPVASTSPDFSRMQKKTRDWVLFLDDLVIVAEVATVLTTLPKNMRRTIRNGKLFISAVFDEVNYMVAAKSNQFYKG